MTQNDFIANHDDPILITGSSGFLGTRVVKVLLDYGYRNLRCFVRPSSSLWALSSVIESYGRERAKIIEGNLLGRDDCERAAEGVSIVYHLAAGRGEKSVPAAFLNSVVTTRNLIEACGSNKNIKRFLNVSSFSVFDNQAVRHNGLLDENCPMEKDPKKRGDAYSYAKVKQDEMVMDRCGTHHIPYVMVRPGVIFGPGNKGIHGRVGIGSFGIFLHLGGSNVIPFTYVDNCAEAVVIAGLKPGIDGEVFNIVDDDLPTSRKFLRLYKKNVLSFSSIYLPRFISYSLCLFWEKYSEWSKGQLPPVYNRKLWSNAWKGNKYSNNRLKALGWKPRIGINEALNLYFEYQRSAGRAK